MLSWILLLPEARVTKILSLVIFSSLSFPKSTADSEVITQIYCQELELVG